MKLEKQGKQINSHGSSHSLVPLWNHWSLLSLHSPPDLQTTTALPNLSAGKSKNAIFRNPWSSQAAFPVFQEKSNKIKANNNIYEAERLYVNVHQNSRCALCNKN